MIKNLLDETNLIANNRNLWSIGIASGDQHYPQHNQAMIDNMILLANDIQIDTFVNLGDTVDLDSVSYWLRIDPLKKLGMRLKQLLLLLLSAIQLWNKVPSIRRKVYLLGNHETRLAKYIMDKPLLLGMFSIRYIALRNGYLYYCGNKHRFHIGDVYFAHGTAGGKTAALSTVNDYCRNIVVGHTHKVGLGVKSTILGAAVGYNCGCACDLILDYQKKPVILNKNGFVVFYHNTITDRTFVKLVEVLLDGSFIYDGKIYG